MNMQIVKMIAKVVSIIGTNQVVSNVAKATTPKNLTTTKKLATAIGYIVISNVVGDAIGDAFAESVEEAVVGFQEMTIELRKKGKTNGTAQSRSKKSETTSARSTND